MTSIRLSDKDLDFVVEEAAPEFADKTKLKRLIMEDQAFRKRLVSDERVFRRVMTDEEVILRISPHLYFEILLRNALKELERASHTIERVGSRAIPVFDAQKVVDLLSRELFLNYLVALLSSFTKIKSYVMSIRVKKGVERKIRFNDMDIECLIKFCEVVEEEKRFWFYKRIADVCLFILGIFPEYVQCDYRHPCSERWPRMIGWQRSMEAYEEEGRRFYQLAGEHPEARNFKLSEVFWILSENFNTARKPLNFISERYLALRKHKLFGMGTY